MNFWRLNKFILLSFWALFFAKNSHAQAERMNIQRLAFHEKIDQKQNFIDIIDGERDQAVTFKDPLLSKRATYTYISLIDSIQHLLDEQNTDGVVTYNYLLQVYAILYKINVRNYDRVDYYQSLIENLYHIIKHKGEPQFSFFLTKDIPSSIRNIFFFKETKEAAPFLLKAVQLYPNEVLKEIKAFADEEYALEIVEAAARVSPMAIKKYFSSKNLVNGFVEESQDSVVQLIVNLFNQYGHGSKSFFFIDMIYHQEISPSIAHNVANQPMAYLSALIRAKQKNNPIGNYDLESELSIKALEQVRVANDLHDLTDTSKRFEVVRNMGPLELYTLMVYSPEEIFTSTFNGLFERLLKQMKHHSMDGFQLLDQVSYNKFRTFIKQCAGYNSLEKFLSTMPEDQALALLKKFVAELHTENGDISEAVNVADTFGSLDDLEYLLIFEEFLTQEFENSHAEDNTKVLYGLLLKLLFQKMNTVPDSSLMAALSPYALPPIEHISFLNPDSLAGTTQMHFFFDDDDGIMSFQTFISAFRLAGFKIKEHEYYVQISSVGKKPTVIYANYPKFEREGQAQLAQMVEEDIIQPSIIVHRGHSYYVNNTISRIPSYAKVVFLGSCGGYHNISEVIKKAPQAHIIASKQIGTYTVNNTLLVEISKVLNQQTQLDWTPLWNSLDKKLKGSGLSYERFLDYVPPHRNMGAIFIQAYNRLTKEWASN